MCKIEKVLSDFSDRADCKSKKRAQCKDCNSTRFRNYYSLHKEEINRKARIWDNENRRARYHGRLKKKFGLTAEDYSVLLSSQDGRCAICYSLDPGGRGIFHVDHDHKTGKVRGLLCSYCNTGLGLFKDNVFILEKAVEYLDKSNGEKF